MKKTAIFLVAVMMISLVLASCGNSSDELTGVWKEKEGDGILFFAEKNAGYSSKVDYLSESFEYEAKDGLLTFTSNESTVETEYTVESNVLTIKTADSEYKYLRVEDLDNDDDIGKYLEENGIETDVLPGEAEGTTKEETLPETEKTPEKDTDKKDDDPKEQPTDKEIAESIIGGWWEEGENLSLLYVFYEDGTGVAGIFPFTYSVKDGVISMQIMGFGEVESGSARYEISGDCLYVDGRDRDCVLTRTEVPEKLKEFPESLKEQLEKLKN